MSHGLVVVAILSSALVFFAFVVPGIEGTPTLVPRTGKN